MAQLEKIGVVILAAGESSRLKIPKWLIQDEKKVPRLTSLMRSLFKVGLSRAVLVLGNDMDTFFLHFPNLRDARSSWTLLEGISIRVAFHPQPEQGPFSSLQIGLTTLLEEGALEWGAYVLPIDVDCPGKDVWTSLSGNPHRVSVPAFDSRGGHPVFLSRDFIGRLLLLPPESPESRLDVQIKKLPAQSTTRVEVSDPRVLSNRNHPSDYGSFLIRSTCVVCPQGTREAAIWIEDQKIREILPWGKIPSGVPVYDYGQNVVMPGIVETHAHLNEPGRTEWEGFETATCGAAAGGITTLIDMPLNSIPATVDTAALELKRNHARGRCNIDVGFWGGIIPGSEGKMKSLCDQGIFGFKIFLIDSGVAEFPPISLEALNQVMPCLKPVSYTHLTLPTTPYV